MQPLKVIIADDEPLLLDEMKALPWDILKSSIVGAAANGEQALEMASKLSPDVIITDITMPRMSGLELLQKVKETNPSIQVIVLTCHGDFAYAQTALRLGAIDYLMKVDLSTESMRAALEKARTQLVKEHSHQRVVREDGELDRIKQLHHWFNNDTSPELTTADLMRANLPIPCIPACLRVSLPSRHLALVSRILERLISQMEQSVSHTSVSLPVSLYDTLLFFPGLFGVSVYAEKLRRLIAVLEQQLAEELPFVLERFVMVGYVSRPCARLDLFPSMISDINAWRDASFYAANREVWIGECKPSRPLTQQLVSDIQAQMARFEQVPEKLAHFLQSDFKQFAEQERVKPDDLKRLAITWLTRWENTRQQHPSTDSLFEGVITAPTLNHLLDVLAKSLETSLPPGFWKKYRSEVRQAMELILQDLSSPISLTSLAEQVGLSPQYFSQVFKSETGDSFSHFVNRARIDLARELLRTGKWKVYEVAEKVGIPNYRYFCDVFRRYTGSSPTESRRSFR